MQEFSNLIERATQRLPSQYFKVWIDGGNPIYRERVYCYELYHQLRCLWPIETDYYLNGELDKAAHPILSSLGAAGIKPDLLVHKPGCMTGNHAVIEVKTSRAMHREIKKDLKNLALFKNIVGYERAIFLVFGHEAKDKLDQIRNIAKEIDDLPKIELWSHSSPGEPALYQGDA